MDETMMKSVMMPYHHRRGCRRQEHSEKQNSKEREDVGDFFLLDETGCENSKKGVAEKESIHCSNALISQ